MDGQVQNNPDGSFSLQFPQPSPPQGHWEKGPSPVKSLNDLTFEAPPDPKLDALKTAGSQFALGATADIAATPTILPTVMGAAGRGLEYGYERAKQALGLQPEGKTASDVLKEQQQKIEKIEPTPEEVKSGDFVDLGLGEPGAPALYPTSQWFERKIKENVPALDYEPFYESSKLAGTPARFMGSAAIGPVEGVAGRIGAAGVSGLASEAAGKYVSSIGYQDYENAARLIGSFAGLPVGNLAARGINNFTQPNTAARNALSSAIAEDFRNNESAMTPQEVEQAYQNGLNPMPYDYAGPRTRAMLEQLGLNNPLARQYMGAINTELADRTTKVSENFRAALKDMFGYPVDPVNVAKGEALVGKQQRDNLYDFIKNTPEAQAVPLTNELKELSQSDTMKSVFSKAESNGTDPKSEIVSPKFIKGTPDTEETFLHTDRGIVHQPAVSGKPDQYIPGNLAYYDEAKQVLDGKIQAAITAKDSGEVGRLQTLKKQLTSALDKAVPGYDAVRDIASETFNAASAPQAGYNFMKNMDIFKGDKLAEGLNKYTTPSQRQDFAMGSAAYLQEMLDKQGIEAVSNYMNQPNAAARMKLALGNEMFDDIYGHVQSQNLMGKIKPLSIPVTSVSQEAPSLVKTSGAGALAGYITSLAQGKELTATDTAGLYATLGGLAGATGAAIINGKQAAIGDKILKLASSGKPSDWRQIGQMARENQNVPEFLAKMGQYADGAGLNLVRSMPAPQYATRPNGFSRGGSVIEKAADKLIGETMRNQKLLANHTEHMLSMPDDAIVQALHVARSVAD